MSATAYEPEEWFLKYPERYRKHPKIKPIAVKLGWVHTTDWLFPILIEARQARKGGALIIMGEPVTPQNIGDLIEAWWPIEEAWVHVMIEAGLFSLCPDTGAIVVECRHYFYGYDSDTPGARRERKRNSRENKRNEQASAPVAVVTQSRQVTTESRLVTTGHERSRLVTSGHDLSRVCHDKVTTRHECHDETRSDQIRSDQTREDLSISPSESDRAIERSSDSPISELDAFRLQKVAQKAYDGFKPKPNKRFFTLCEHFLQTYAGAYGADVVCLALEHAGYATAWAQRHGPSGVSESSINNYAMSCAKNQLAAIQDRENDRAFARQTGQRDPGPLLWIPPDQEAML